MSWSGWLMRSQLELGLITSEGNLCRSSSQKNGHRMFGRIVVDCRLDEFNGSASLNLNPISIAI